MELTLFGIVALFLNYKPAKFSKMLNDFLADRLSDPIQAIKVKYTANMLVSTYAQI